MFFFLLMIKSWVCQVSKLVEINIHFHIRVMVQEIYWVRKHKPNICQHTVETCFLSKLLLLQFWIACCPGGHYWDYFIDRLAQEKRNSIAKALELCLSCASPSIWLSYQSIQITAAYLKSWGLVDFIYCHLTFKWVKVNLMKVPQNILFQCKGCWWHALLWCFTVVSQCYWCHFNMSEQKEWNFSAMAIEMFFA